MRRCSASPTAAASVERIVAGGETVYGVNTGFGLLANTRIPDDRLAELQTNLILSHSAGPRRSAAAPRHAADDRAEAARPRPRLFGRPAAGDRRARRRCSTATRCRSSRARAASAPVGRSRPARAPHRGADGLRRDRPRRRRHARRPRRSQKLGMEPLELGPKEGLALINGTQASTAIALDALFAGERVFAAAIAAGALSVDALKGSVKPFDPRISELRGQPGPDPRRRRDRAACSTAARSSPATARCGRGPGPLQLPLPAAGDGRRARPARPTPRAR